MKKIELQDNPKEQLVTERLVLRRWREEDRLPFRNLNADVRVMEFMPGPLDAEASDAMMDRLKQHFDQHLFGVFVAELRESRSFVGFIGLGVPDFDAAFMPAVEIAWRLAAEHWGRGLATEGAHEVLRYGFEEVGLSSVVSFTVPSNVRSRRVMEKLGMVHDTEGDFKHPRLPVGHVLRDHVLYRIDYQVWRQTHRA